MVLVQSVSYLTFTFTFASWTLNGEVHKPDSQKFSKAFYSQPDFLYKHKRVAKWICTELSQCAWPHGPGGWCDISDF